MMQQLRLDLFGEQYRMWLLYSGKNILEPKEKNEWNKWKNHFHEMKGGVGMSSHEKQREQEDAYTKTESHS